MFDPPKNRTIVVISLFTVIVSLIVMAGWAWNKPVLQQVIPGFVEMVFNTALCFILFSTALLITQFSGGKYKFIYALLALAGTAIGIVTLLEFLFSFNAGIDEMFVTDRRTISTGHPYGGRMAFNAAVNVVLLGAGFLLLLPQKRRFNNIAQYIFHIVTILSAAELLGYLYGVSLFKTVLFISSMAAHTAVLFLLISIAAARLNPDIGFARLFMGKSIGSQMAKRLFSLMILMVLVFGSLRVQAQHFPVFSLDIWISLLAVSFLLVSLFLIWNTANWLNRVDAKRTEAEAEVKRMNTGLEKMVQERSAESKNNEEKYRSLIEQASDAIYVLDVDMNFTDVNASMCTMIGYSKDELLKMNVRDIVEPGELKSDPLRNIIDNPETPLFRERTFVRKNGSIFTVEVNVKVFPGRMVMVMARDITERKKIEAERKEAEHIILKEKMLSDTIINSLPGVFYLVTSEGKQVRWNANFEALTGYSSSELEQLNSFDLVAPEDHGELKKAIEKVFEEGYAVIEASIAAKNGTKTPMLLTGTPILYEGRRCLVGMGIDISSRIKAEAELRASEHKYKVLFDSSPMPLWMIDKDTLNIIAVNDVAADLYGYSREELLNMNVRELRPPDDQERQLAGYRKGASGEALDMGTVKHLKKDGTPMYVNIVAHDIVFEGREVRLSFTNDVTERLKAEEALKNSEANLQTILKTTDILFTTLSKDLEILAFNAKASEFVERNYKRTLEKGQRITDYMSPERAPQVLANLKKVLRGQAITYELDYRGYWYNVSFSPIMSEEKEILGMLLTMDEITERKKAEENLKTAYGRIQSQINSIKGMAWKQSHLMRSPLANLKALADLLREHPADTESLTHFQTELDRLDTIIHEMAQDASDHVI